MKDFSSFELKNISEKLKVNDVFVISNKNCKVKCK